MLGTKFVLSSGHTHTHLFNIDQLKLTAQIVHSPTAAHVHLQYAFHLPKQTVSRNLNLQSHRIQIPATPPVGICPMFFSCNIGPHH